MWSRSVTIREPAKNTNTNTNTSAGADKDVDQLPCGNTFRKLTKIHLQIQIEIKIAIPTIQNTFGFGILGGRVR